MADELIGKKIGGYEILELVGHGGMATVYRARQISMNRIVAVKVLPRQFLNDETYMQRFLREVKIVAELEHRSIVPVHDYGEAEGQPYIVMRYMAGGSVDDLLHSGTLDLNGIVSIVEQIAPALDYAHSKGVLHRDLKPSNILMDDDGGAYLTDFGIARLMSEAAAGATLTTHGVVGTPSYMSPEQAQGQPLDGRSDIYSLGVSLFEMTTGQRPFEGDTPYGIAVLQVTARPPDPRSINSELPVGVENVILTAMSKKREDRYGTAVRLAEALKAATDPTTLFDTQPGFHRPEPVNVPVPAQSSPPAYTPPPPSSPYVIPVVAPRRRLVPRRGGNLWMSAAVGGLIGCGLLAILALLAILLISTFVRGGSGTPTPAIPGGIVSPAPTSSLPAATTPPTNTSLAPTNTQVAPVGQRDTPAPLTSGSIVYFAERDGNFDIYAMNLTTRAETRLTSADSTEVYPSVSPDGKQIAFMSDQDGNFEIEAMNADGSGQRRLTYNSVTDRAPSWSPDGAWIVYSSDTRGDGADDLYRVSAAGGAPQPLLSDGQRNSDPRYTGDGSAILFTGGSGDDGSTWEIKRLDPATGNVTVLTNNAVKDWQPRPAPDGGILYLTEGSGHAAIAHMSADGSGSRLLYDGVGYDWGAAYNPAGDLISFTSDVSGRDELYLMSADGSDVRSITDAGGLDACWLPS